jgi:tRNA G18 (ribose-2'-O)-methylase SpoU
MPLDALAQPANLGLIARPCSAFGTHSTSAPKICAARMTARIRTSETSSQPEHSGPFRARRTTTVRPALALYASGISRQHASAPAGQRGLSGSLCNRA